ncbi:unnamed protein product [Toxocara canis]|uniref:DUF4817 domain-containing protein n=1 Tax=Toxocara canis TaxID=6265 RepID=A0A183TVT3_TOXCA|nr:unnamed protein product [Toxocara canis]
MCLAVAGKRRVVIAEGFEKHLRVFGEATVLGEPYFPLQEWETKTCGACARQEREVGASGWPRYFSTAHFMSMSPASFPRRYAVPSNSSTLITEWRTSASSSRMLSAYEISDDLSRRQIQVLERRYGGRLRAHAAATRIQRAFRQYRMMQQWRRLVVPLQHWNSGVTHIRCIESVTRWRSGNVNAAQPQRICDASRYANASDSSLQQQQWSRRNCICSPSTQVNPTNSIFRGTPLPNRYHPSVSLSAQLRATRSNERSSPPSPARIVSESTAHRPYAELMSPRLSHRR